MQGNVPVGGIGVAGRDYVQDERYFAMEHMDVRRDPVSFVRGSMNRRETRLPQVTT